MLQLSDFFGLLMAEAVKNPWLSIVTNFMDANSSWMFPTSSSKA